MFWPTRVHVPTLKARQVRCWMTTQKVSTHAPGYRRAWLPWRPRDWERRILTNFALAGRVAAHEHAVAAGEEPGAAQEPPGKALARLDGLHSEILAHGFGYRVEVFAILEVPLGHELDLRTPGIPYRQ